MSERWDSFIGAYPERQRQTFVDFHIGKAARSDRERRRSQVKLSIKCHWNAMSHYGYSAFQGFHGPQERYEDSTRKCGFLTVSHGQLNTVDSYFAASTQLELSPSYPIQDKYFWQRDFGMRANATPPYEDPDTGAMTTSTEDVHLPLRYMDGDGPAFLDPTSRLSMYEWHVCQDNLNKSWPQIVQETENNSTKELIMSELIFQGMESADSDSEEMKMAWLIMKPRPTGAAARQGSPWQWIIRLRSVQVETDPKFALVAVTSALHAMMDILNRKVFDWTGISGCSEQEAIERTLGSIVLPTA